MRHHSVLRTGGTDPTGLDRYVYAFEGFGGFPKLKDGAPLFTDGKRLVKSRLRMNPS